MPLYEYHAKNNRGEGIQDVMESESEILVAESLHQQDLVVVSIRERKLPFAFKFDLWNQIKTIKFSRKKVKLNDLYLFISQLGPLLEAGLTLTGALRSLARETQNPTFREAIETVRQDIERGENFHVALSRHPHVFSPLIVNLVRAGELSGQLDTTLNQLADYLERMADLRRSIISAVSYPVFLISFLIIVLCFIMLKLVPIFQETYSEFGVQLPLMTQILIGASDFVRSNFIYILLVAFGCITALIVARRLKIRKIQYAIDGLKLKLPILGPLIKKVSIARFARTLSVLTMSGIPILEGMNVAGEISNNQLIELAVKDCVFDIERGSGIADSLATKKIFPDMLVQLVSTGEQTGALDKMLQNGARFYEKQVEAITRVLTSILEPILIIIVAVIVGIILISLFLPIFYLGEAFMH